MGTSSINKNISIHSAESAIVLITLCITLISQFFMPFVLTINSIENILYIPLVFVVLTSSKVNIKTIPLFFHLLLIIASSIAISNALNGANLNGFLFAFRPIKYYFLGIATYSFFPDCKLEFKQILTLILTLSITINLLMLFNPFGWGVSLLKYYSNHTANFELNSELSKNFRLFGSFNSPNDNGVFWGLILSFALSYKSFFQSRWRIILIVLSLIFITLTQSRTTIIALIFSVSIFFIIRKFNLKTIIILATGLILAYIILINSGLSYLKQMASFDILKVHSLTLRYDAWEACMNIWKQHPIFGIGNQKTAFEMSGYHPDSEYVYLLISGGIVLVFGYVIFFTLMFIHCFAKLKNNSNSIFPIIGGLFLLVNAITNYSFVNPEIAILFIFLTAISLTNKQKIIH